METSVSGLKGEFGGAMNLLPSVLFFAVSLPYFCKASEPIELTNTSGKSIRAELISFDSTTNTIRYKRLRDARVFTSPIGLFDGATQERLQSNITTENESTIISVTASQKQVYDHARELWKEPAPEETIPAGIDVMRSVFDLKNNDTNDFKNLKVDIATVVGPYGNSEICREVRQTFSILRLRSGENIQVQSKRYELRVLASEVAKKEIIRGTGLRLRDAETGATIFMWQSKSLSNQPISWEKPEPTSPGLTAMLEN